jgi:hypothetical protein
MKWGVRKAGIVGNDKRWKPKYGTIDEGGLTNKPKPRGAYKDESGATKAGKAISESKISSKVMNAVDKFLKRDGNRPISDIMNPTKR